MADDVDRAAEHTERERAGLLAQRRPIGRIPGPNGRCFWCDEIVGDQQRWCDVDCTRAWEKDKEKRS